MSLGAERRTIEERWLAKWVADNGADPLTATQFEGVPFVVGEEPDAKKGDCWVRLTVRHGEGRQASAGSPGSNIFRQPGLVMLQLFAPSGQGTQQIRELGDKALAVFRSIRLGQLFFQAPTFELLDAENLWQRALVTAPFYRDENH